MKLYLKKIVSWGTNKILEDFDFDWTLPYQGEKVSQLKSHSCMVSPVFSVEMGEVDLSDTDFSDLVVERYGKKVRLGSEGKLSLDWQNEEKLINQQIANGISLGEQERLGHMIVTLAAKVHLLNAVPKGPVDYDGPYRDILQYREVCGDWGWRGEPTDSFWTPDAESTVQRTLYFFNNKVTHADGGKINNFEIMRKACLFREFNPQTLVKLISRYPLTPEETEKFVSFAWEVGNSAMLSAIKAYEGAKTRGTTKSKYEFKLTRDSGVVLSALNRHHHIAVKTPACKPNYDQVGSSLMNAFDKPSTAESRAEIMKEINFVFIRAQLAGEFTRPRVPEQFNDVCGDKYDLSKAFPEDVKIEPFNILRKVCLLKLSVEVLSKIVRVFLPLVGIKDQRRCLRFACEVGNARMLDVLLNQGVSLEHELDTTSPVLCALRNRQYSIENVVNKYVLYRDEICNLFKSQWVYNYLFGHIRNGGDVDAFLTQSLSPLNPQSVDIELLCMSREWRSEDEEDAPDLPCLRHFMSTNHKNVSSVREKLSLACEVGNLAAVKIILSFYDTDTAIGRNIRAILLDGVSNDDSVLSMAAISGHKRVVEELIASGANIALIHVNKALQIGDGRSAFIEVKCLEKALKKCVVSEGSACVILKLFVGKIRLLEKRGALDFYVLKTCLDFAMKHLDAFMNPFAHNTPFESLVGVKSSVLSKYFFNFMCQRQGSRSNAFLFLWKIVSNKNTRALRCFLNLNIQSLSEDYEENRRVVGLLYQLKILLMDSSHRWEKGGTLVQEALQEIHDKFPDLVSQHFLSQTHHAQQMPPPQPMSSSQTGYGQQMPPPQPMSSSQTGYGQQMPPPQPMSSSQTGYGQQIPPPQLMSSSQFHHAQQMPSPQPMPSSQFHHAQQMPSPQPIPSSQFHHAQQIPPPQPMSSSQFHHAQQIPPPEPIPSSQFHHAQQMPSSLQSDDLLNSLFET